MDNLTGVQLSEWEAYDKLDPIGTWREDFRSASLMALVSNMMKGKEDKANTPLDFMPDWDKSKKEKTQSVEDMKRAIMSIAKTQTKKVEKEEALLKKINKPPVIKRKNGNRHTDSDHRG